MFYHAITICQPHCIPSDHAQSPRMHCMRAWHGHHARTSYDWKLAALAIINSSAANASLPRWPGQALHIQVVHYRAA